MLRLSQNLTRRGDGGKNGPLFLAIGSPCRSVGAGCVYDPCRRLAIAGRGCQCGGGRDDGCCRRHHHTGAFSFSWVWPIARREKPAPTRVNRSPELGSSLPHAKGSVMTAFHPTEPVTTRIANGRCGASLADARLRMNRQLSASKAAMSRCRRVPADATETRVHLGSGQSAASTASLSNVLPRLLGGGLRAPRVGRLSWSAQAEGPRVNRTVAS
jgi:hypothetical protein